MSKAVSVTRLSTGVYVKYICMNCSYVFYLHCIFAGAIGIERFKNHFRKCEMT